MAKTSRKVPEVLQLQSSLTGDPNGHDWIAIPADEIPEWAKNKDVTVRFVNGEMCCFDPQGKGPWFRAVILPPPDATGTFYSPESINDARKRVAKNLENHRDLLTVNGEASAFAAFVNNLDEVLLLIYHGEINAPGSGHNPELVNELFYRFEKLFERAKKDRIAYDAALGVAAKYLGLGVPLPIILGTWVADHLKKKHCRPRKHGRSKYQNWVRDIIIAFEVRVLELHGLTATRNDGSKKKTAKISGCDIVAEEFTKVIGTSLTYIAAEKIWSRLNKGF